MKKIIIFLLTLFLIGCSPRLHHLSDKKEFTVDKNKSEEVWSKAHHYLTQTYPEKFAKGFVTDYSIIISGFADNRDFSYTSRGVFTPYYYTIAFSRYIDEGKYNHTILITGSDFEEPRKRFLDGGASHKNSKESGLLQEEIEKFYENITGVKK